MKDRNKIITQILVVASQYDIEIMRIEFNSYSFISDKVTVTYKQNNIKQIVSYSFEKGNNQEINTFIKLFTYELQDHMEVKK